jgi:hypothetical protein
MDMKKEQIESVKIAPAAMLDPAFVLYAISGSRRILSLMLKNMVATMFRRACLFVAYCDKYF